MNYVSATDLARAIAAKEISSVELMADTLGRIEALNPAFNALVALADPDRLMSSAQQADAALARGEHHGFMHGMPHAVKDLLDLEGFVTSRGSPLFAQAVAAEDAIIVQRIRAAGAIFIGKTNVPEFGLGSQSYNRVYGSTKNAFDVGLTAGGSSGGAACGLATGLLPVADGSDMMGSLRNPAAFNNVVGFRPGLGRVPGDPLGDVFFGQLSTLGPMARTVEDLINLFGIIGGFDSRLPLTHQQPIKAPGVFRKADLATTRVGWLADYDGYLPTEAGVLDLCEIALGNLRTAGVTLDRISIDFPMADLWRAWLNLRSGQIANGFKPLYDNPDRRAELKPEVVWEIEQGQNVGAMAVYQASAVRSDWYRRVLEAFEQWDILALPAAQVFPFAVEQHWPDQVGGRAMDTYHRWMEVTIGGSLSGCPVISLPAGFDEVGRAMGIQFIAPLGEDEKLLEFALAYEEVNPWAGFYYSNRLLD